MKETLFEYLYLRESFRKNRPLQYNLSSDQLREEITDEIMVIKRKSLSNPLLARMIEGESPHEILEFQRRDKFSRWLGLGRWLPIGHDKKHEERQEHLKEIFTNIGHYQSRGIYALDNPVTLAFYGSLIGFGTDAVPLAQHGLNAVFSGLSSADTMPDLSVYEALASTQAGIALGTLLGYIRRTRKVDWTQLIQKIINVEFARVPRRERAWDQADYMRYKFQEMHTPLDELIKKQNSVYIIPSNASEDERNNAWKNPLLKKLGINVEYEFNINEMVPKIVRSKILE